MIYRSTITFLILFISSAALGTERYEKKVILKMTSADYFKYASTYDFDDKGNVWLLDSDHGLVKVFDRSKKVILIYSVPTRDPAQFTVDPGKSDAQDDNSKNFNLRVDECGNFVVYTDAFPTKVIEFNSAGKIMKEDFLKMERFDDVCFREGKIYSKPDDIEVESLSPVDCPAGSAEPTWNDFFMIKVNLYTPYGLKLSANSGEMLEFNKFKDMGTAFIKILNIVRDRRGNFYVTIQNYSASKQNDDHDSDDPGSDFGEVNEKTYKFDKNFQLLCMVPADVERVNLENETMYSVERVSNDKTDDFVFEKWEKVN